MAGWRWANPRRSRSRQVAMPPMLPIWRSRTTRSGVEARTAKPFRRHGILHDRAHACRAKMLRQDGIGGRDAERRGRWCDPGSALRFRDRLEIDRKAGRARGPAVAADQLVVATAAQDRIGCTGRVRAEPHAGVVVEAAQIAEIDREIARGHARRRVLVEKREVAVLLSTRLVQRAARGVAAAQSCCFDLRDRGRVRGVLGWYGHGTV